MRKLGILLALAFLPTLCLAGSIDNFYQVNVTGQWTATNPLCISNCTETVTMSYEYEKNNDVFNQNSPTNGIFGWIVGSTVKGTSSGFLGAFNSFQLGLMPDYGSTSLAPAFYTSLGFEVDLANPDPGVTYEGSYYGSYTVGPANLLIYDCGNVSICQTLYPYDPEATDILPADKTTAVITPVPAGDSAWELILVSAIVCTFGLFVKHRLGLTPSR